MPGFFNEDFSLTVSNRRLQSKPLHMGVMSEIGIYEQLRSPSEPVTTITAGISRQD